MWTVDFRHSWTSPLYYSLRGVPLMCRVADESYALRSSLGT